MGGTVFFYFFLAGVYFSQAFTFFPCQFFVVKYWNFVFYFCSPGVYQLWHFADFFYRRHVFIWESIGPSRIRSRIGIKSRTFLAGDEILVAYFTAQPHICIFEIGR